MAVPIIVVTPCVAYVAVRLGIHRFNAWAGDSGSLGGAKTGSPASTSVIDVRLAVWLAGLVALVATLAVLGEAWERRERTVRRRPSGDVKPLDHALELLERQGFVVMRGVPVPDREPVANRGAVLDCLVIGPTGVYAIDIERHRPSGRPATIGPDRLPPAARLAGARADAERVSEAVADDLAAAGVGVMAMMCVVGSAAVAVRDVDGVRVVWGGRALRTELRRRAVVLHAPDIAQLSEDLRHTLAAGPVLATVAAG